MLSKAWMLFRANGLMAVLVAAKVHLKKEVESKQPVSAMSLGSPSRFWRREEKSVGPAVTIKALGHTELPKVSFIVPTWGSANYLYDAIHSISRSTTEYHECIVVDDGNESRSHLLALAKIEPASPKQALRFVAHEKNLGLAAARNTGAGFSRGEFVLFIDDDDTLLPGSTDFHLDAMTANGSDFSLGEFWFFDQESREFIFSTNGIRDCKMKITGEAILQFWERGITIPIHSVLFRRDGLPQFDSSLRSKEDFYFWSQIFDSHRHNLLSVPVCVYRIHKQQMTHGAKLLHGVYLMEVLYKTSQRIEGGESSFVKGLAHVATYYGQPPIDFWAATSLDRSRWLQKIQRAASR